MTPYKKKVIVDKLNQIADIAKVERPKILMDSYVEEFKELKRMVNHADIASANMLIDQLIDEFQSIADQFRDYGDITDESD